MKPTLDSKYHIDYEWWDNTPGEDLRIYLLTHLPPALRDKAVAGGDGALMDFIDPVTGEISRLDALALTVRQVAEAPDFINRDIGVVDCIFRVFLKNSNTPLSPRELSLETGHDAMTILRLLSGTRVYKGLRQA
jgi:hypothetical protein